MPDIIRDVHSAGFWDNLKPGDTVKFGLFRQEILKVKTPLEWLALDVTDSHETASGGREALLLSCKVLFFRRFHVGGSTNWAISELREILNGNFASMAFSAAELEMIAVSHLHDEACPGYVSHAGEVCQWPEGRQFCPDTEDRVFCLSIAEVKKYFPAKEDRLCGATPWALRGDNLPHKKTAPYFWWWLRSPTDADLLAASVGYEGDICRGNYVGNSCGVRPALRIKET
ncbi:DUF6273 domain-containing protein [Succinimonas sp.]|uniref:DUF6273 domain-containing protein n=1 Tax=Succinimonas sp. TaxID=1936151 RepID=UPI00386BB0D4